MNNPPYDSPEPVPFERWSLCPNRGCPTSKEARGIPEFLGFAHVTVYVSDLERSVSWYRDVLGFEEPWFSIAERVAVLFHPESEVEIVMRQGRVLTHDPGEPIFHAAFRVKDAEQLQAWERHLGRQGIDARITRAIGGANIDVQDPDGNDLELFVYDPPR